MMSILGPKLTHHQETMAMNMLTSLIPILPRQPKFKVQALLWLLKKFEKDSTPVALQLKLNTLTGLLKGEEDFIYSSIGTILHTVAEV